MVSTTHIIDLIISGKKIIVNVDSNIDYDDLVVKIYVEFGESGISYDEIDRFNSPPLKIEDSNAEYTFQKEPNYILATLINSTSGELIDFREFSFGWRYREGIVLDLDEFEIREIIRRGEDIDVEFKENIANTDRILDTIVAFANTQGGRIFVGVSDDTQIKGYPPDIKEDITNQVSVHLEPKPTLNFEKIKIGEKTVHIIEVLEGDNKPYSHRERGIYIRRSATNRRATRTDLDAIYSTGPKSIL